MCSSRAERFCRFLSRVDVYPGNNADFQGFFFPFPLPFIFKWSCFRAFPRVIIITVTPYFLHGLQEFIEQRSRHGLPLTAKSRRAFHSIGIYYVVHTHRYIADKRCIIIDFREIVCVGMPPFCRRVKVSIYTIDAQYSIKKKKKRKRERNPPI